MNSLETTIWLDARPISFAVPSIEQSDVDAVVEVMRSGWITTGAQCAAFEAELAAYLDVSNVVTCSSATTAEEIALAHLRLPPGARVGVPNWTFVSTALAVHRAGATPVLIDVDHDDLNISARSLEAAIAEGLDAVVGVHFAGVPFSRSIRELCAGAGIPLIEDAAHALGASDDRGMVAGKETAGACFSFYATKNLSTGEGGAIATDDDDLAKFARTYRLHGMSADALDRYKTPGFHRYDVIEPGIKANLSDLNAALGRSQLARFPEMQRRRRELVQSYRDGLAGQDLRIVPNDQVAGSADHLFVVDLLNAQRCQSAIRALAAEDIGSSVHFRPLHTFEWFEATGVPSGPTGLDVSAGLDGQVMSLPLHVGLADSDLDRVIDVLVASLAS